MSSLSLSSVSCPAKLDPISEHADAEDALCAISQFWNKGWIYFCDSNEEWFNCGFPYVYNSEEINFKIMSTRN
jgi:hypothetical protein